MAEKPTIAPPFKPNSRRPMTPEEREARYEYLERMSMLSPIHATHRNPDWVVRWVFNGKVQSDITIHKAMGFEFATDNPKAPESERQVETTVQISDDGFYRLGDVILMQIPRMDYEFFMARNVNKSRLMVDNGKESFKEEAKRIKLPTGKRAFKTFDREEPDSEKRFHD